MNPPSNDTAAPLLKQFAGLWTLTHQPSPAAEWSLEEKFARAKEAGFDAIGGGTLPEVVPLCAEYGLEYICYLDGNLKYPERLKAAQATNPRRINVQLCDHDTPLDEAVEIWIKMEAAAEEMGLKLDLEVHRDTSTETPEKTYEIARLYEEATGKKLRFCFDFSHIAVVKHLAPPYADRLLVRPDLVQLTRQVHFRPFNGQHCQIPATDGQGRDTPEFADYLQFVDAFLACWLQGDSEGETLYACPEFGPVISGYGISSFPNVWRDAILLRERTAAIWTAKVDKWMESRKPRT